MQAIRTLARPTLTLRERLRAYWQLIKSLQTGLLLFTGYAGYLSAVDHPVTLLSLVGLGGSLALAISGSTVLNMVYDRDIDALMTRTSQRPLPAGTVGVGEGLILGLLLGGAGVIWAMWIAPIFGALVLLGLLLDVVVYTIWLKRRTPWSVIWGGLSGGMPVLAGRFLGTGQVDLIGLMMALSILLWIPTHMMTFGIKYRDDYARADVPVFPNCYGVAATRTIIAASTISAAVVISVTGWQIGLSWGWLHATVLLGALLIGLALASACFQSDRLNFALFKCASLYMLGVMALFIVGS